MYMQVTSGLRKFLLLGVWKVGDEYGAMESPRSPRLLPILFMVLENLRSASSDLAYLSILVIRHLYTQFCSVTYDHVLLEFIVTDIKISVQFFDQFSNYDIPYCFSCKKYWYVPLSCWKNSSRYSLKQVLWLDTLDCCCHCHSVVLLTVIDTTFKTLEISMRIIFWRSCCISIRKFGRQIYYFHTISEVVICLSWFLSASLFYGTNTNKEWVWCDSVMNNGT